MFAEKKDAFLFFIQKKVSVLQEILFSRYIDISLFVGFKEIISLCVSKTICWKKYSNTYRKKPCYLPYMSMVKYEEGAEFWFIICWVFQPPPQKKNPALSEIVLDMINNKEFH